MAVARTWKLQLNLDDFNALAMSLYQDADRALAFQGIALGFNGSAAPDGVPAPFLRGYAFGKSTRDEAEAFREGKKTAGKLGGRPAHREEPHGLPHGLPRGEPIGIPCGLPNPITTSENRKAENREQKTENKQPAAPDFPGVTVTPRATTANAAPAWKSFEDRCSERRAKWLEESGPCDFTKRPGKLQFESYCRAVHPQWTKGPLMFDEWALHGWNYRGKPIGSWFQLLDSFAKAADQTEYGERFEMGQISQRLNLADGMNARHLAKGEPL